MKVTVEVRGLEEVRRELTRLSASIQTRLARNATMAGARVGAKYARQRVPVLTGALKRSIKARRNPAKQRGRVESLVNAKSPIAHLIEFGTVKMSPRPFLSAWTCSAGSIVSRLPWPMAKKPITSRPATSC